MKKVWVLAAVLTSVAALTLNAQDVKKEQVKQEVKKEQVCQEKKEGCKKDSCSVATDKKDITKEEKQKK